MGKPKYRHTIQVVVNGRKMQFETVRCLWCKEVYICKCFRTSKTDKNLTAQPENP